MNINIKILAITFLLFSLTNCNNSNSEKQKDLSIKEIEIVKPKISTNEAKLLAEKQFENYLPKILKSQDAILDVQESYTGDFTGDGIEDVAIYFVLAPSGGGNAIVGQGLTLYQNSGSEIKVIAGYEPDNLFRFDKISNGKIYIEKLEYADDDGSCCPSIKTEHILTISGNKAY